MRALELNEQKELAIVDCQKAEIADGEVRIAVKAAGLNHRDLWIRKGMYPGMTLPCILGADGAGEVVELGKNVDQAWLGKEVIIYPAHSWGDKESAPEKSFRVLGMPNPGTMAEFISVPLKYVFEKPAYLSFTEAAAIPIASLTAWRALNYHGQIKEGDQVLITGIGGGVALAGLGFALAKGAKVFVTSSSQSKIDRAISLGAQAGVNYKEDDWPEKLASLSRGIDLVLDSSPVSELDRYLKFLNMGAKIIAYGSTGNRMTSLNISKFFLRHIQFIGTAMGSPKDFKDMLVFMTENEIRPMVDKLFPFSDALMAFDALESGSQFGKIVIEV